MNNIPMQTEQQKNSWVGLFTRLKTVKKSRKRGLGLLWFFSVFAWASLTTVMLMQIVQMRTPIPGQDQGLADMGVSSIVFWVVMTLVPFGYALVRKKAFRNTFLSVRGWLPTLFAILWGAFNGANLFTLSFLDSTVQAVSPVFADFSETRKKMMLLNGSNQTALSVWFDERGALRPEKRETWCQNAIPRAEAFGFMSTTPGREGVEMSALLSQSLYGALRAQGCIDDAQWLGYMHGATARVAQPSRQQRVMESLRVSPVFYAAIQTRPIIMERVVFSQSRACNDLAAAAPAGALKSEDVAAMCQKKFASAHPATVQDISAIENELARLGDAAPPKPSVASKIN